MSTAATRTAPLIYLEDQLVAWMWSLRVDADRVWLVQDVQGEREVRGEVLLRSAYDDGVAPAIARLLAPTGMQIEDGAVHLVVADDAEGALSAAPAAILTRECAGFLQALQCAAPATRRKLTTLFALSEWVIGMNEPMLEEGQEWRHGPWSECCTTLIAIQDGFNPERPHWLTIPAADEDEPGRVVPLMACDLDLTDARLEARRALDDAPAFGIVPRDATEENVALAIALTVLEDARDPTRAVALVHASETILGFDYAGRSIHPGADIAAWIAPGVFTQADYVRAGWERLLADRAAGLDIWTESAEDDEPEAIG